MSKLYKKIQLSKDVKLETYPVYCNKIYDGKEPFRVTGITIKNNEIFVELTGDFSGVGQSIQSDWFPISECFLVRKMCLEELKSDGCQIHNIYCCGGGKVITKHEAYWI